MRVTIYGIKNCNTMKKAFAWLDSAGVAYEFHDYKKRGVEAEKLREWAGKVGWEKLINRAGTTFKGLAEETKAGLDEGKAIGLMAAGQSMIKRPVVEVDGEVIVGFDEGAWGMRWG
ncbi:arsenate reductase [Oryzibacter oryziterrae]|uniref:arsenate reductase n=1 Tax=Oryzibacter oryziterrae TaxID=2766474 RepID=UPI001F488A53|nr:arsenate reductase [Oryzibacter oryziterrae]